jgi:undecaprenyl-diphosphatase
MPEEKQSRLLIAGFLASALTLVFFGWLTRVVLAGESLKFDIRVREAVHSLASGPLTSVMLVVTQMGSSLVLLPLGAFMMWRLIAADRKRAAMIFVAACVGAGALTEVLKLAFRRTRPLAYFGYAEPSSYSFPSGHSIMSACFYGIVAAVLTVNIQSRRKRAAIWAGAVLMALSIGFSRVYLGVHYPTDVLAGYATAVIWVGSVRAGYEVWRRRRRNRSQRLPE